MALVLIGAAVLVVLAFAVMEPATERAAFGHDAGLKARRHLATSSSAAELQLRVFAANRMRNDVSVRSIDSRAVLSMSGSAT